MDVEEKLRKSGYMVLKIRISTERVLLSLNVKN